MDKNLLNKLEKYCAYQERCHAEVVQKAHSIGIWEDDVNLALVHLIEKNFLNEERFVEVFIRSKINQKKWGRYKIEQALRMKKIEKKLLANELDKIDENVWIKNASILAEKHIKLKKIDLKAWQEKAKLVSYLMSKGYSTIDIERVIKILR